MVCCLGICRSATQQQNDVPSSKLIRWTKSRGQRIEEARLEDARHLSLVDITSISRSLAVPVSRAMPNGQLPCPLCKRAHSHQIITVKEQQSSYYHARDKAIHDSLKAASACLARPDDSPNCTYCYARTPHFRLDPLG